MNKRQKKKQAKRPLVSKKLIKLVRKYTHLHDMVDLSSFEGTCFIELGEDIQTDFGWETQFVFKPKMSHKSYAKIEELCRQLFVETRSLTEPEQGYTLDDWDWGNGDNQYDYRIVKCQPKGEYQPYRDKNFNNLNSGYYVNQREISEDNYEGEVYHPLGRGRYLFYRYRC